LLDLGLTPGDRVAVHLANSIEIILSYYACFKAGLIAVPINTRFKSSEIDYVVTHSEAKAYIGHPDLFVDAAGATSHIPLRFLAGGDAPGTQSFNALLTPGTMRALPAVDLDAPAVVLYTSGTTARPKGVTHTHRSLEAMTQCATEVFFANDDRFAVILPMVHIAALCGFLTSVRLEVPAVVLPFDPPAVLDAVEKHQITALSAMPAIFRMLVEAQQAKPRQISSLRAFFVGGDSAPAVLHEQCRQLFGVTLFEVYGLTEGVPLTANSASACSAGSLSKVIKNIDIRLVDSEGREVPRGEVGEVTARGPLICTG
jgi:long-chain acyl-CoA synthetase